MKKFEPLTEWNNANNGMCNEANYCSYNKRMDNLFNIQYHQIIHQFNLRNKICNQFMTLYLLNALDAFEQIKDGDYEKHSEQTTQIALEIKCL